MHTIESFYLYPLSFLDNQLINEKIKSVIRQCGRENLPAPVA